MKVKCISDAFIDLSNGVIYVVQKISKVGYKTIHAIIDDAGDSCHYSPELFEVSEK